jgi:hypothetical protein
VKDFVVALRTYKLPFLKIGKREGERQLVVPSASRLMRKVTETSLTSLLLAPIAVDGPEQRHVMFFVTMAITTLLGATAALGPILDRHLIGSVLEACIEYLWKNTFLRGSPGDVWSTLILALCAVSACKRLLRI